MTDEDLALIEANHPSKLVQRLIWKIRELQDEVADKNTVIEMYREQL